MEGLHVSGKSVASKPLGASLVRPFPNRATRCTSRLVRTQASSPPPATSEEQDMRFRWNPAQSRWERVKAERDADGKYKASNWVESDKAVIKTRTGGSYTVWPVIHSMLTQAKLQSVDAEEALRLQQEEGAVLVDCRADWDYERQHIEGAVSLPLYRGVAGKGAWDTVKRAVMAVGFAMKATERDPDFREKALATLPKDKKIIVYCTVGGTLVVGAQPYKPGGKSFLDDPERMFGRESRSLKAAYELMEAGFKNVLHLKGGQSQWRHDDYPVE